MGKQPTSGTQNANVTHVTKPRQTHECFFSMWL